MSSSKGKEKVEATRIHWTEQMEKLLLDLCVHQVLSSGRPGTNFSPIVWKEIGEKLSAKVGFTITQKQMKNRLYYTKGIADTLFEMYEDDDVDMGNAAGETSQSMGDASTSMDTNARAEMNIIRDAIADRLADDNLQ